MIRAKHYETVFKFVKVMPRILVASFFSGHSVDVEILFNSVLLLHNSFFCIFSVLSVLAVFGLNATIITLV